MRGAARGRGRGRRVRREPGRQRRASRVARRWWRAALLEPVRDGRGRHRACRAPRPARRRGVRRGRRGGCELAGVDRPAGLGRDPDRGPGDERRWRRERRVWLQRGGEWGHRGRGGALRRRGRDLQPGLGVRVRAERERVDPAAEAHGGGRRRSRPIWLERGGERGHRGRGGARGRRGGERRPGLGVRVRAERHHVDSAAAAQRGGRSHRRPVWLERGDERGHGGRGGAPRRRGRERRSGISVRVRAHREYVDPAAEAHGGGWRPSRLFWLERRGERGYGGRGGVRRRRGRERRSGLSVRVRAHREHVDPAAKAQRGGRGRLRLFWH